MERVIVSTAGHETRAGGCIASMTADRMSNITAAYAYNADRLVEITRVPPQYAHAKSLYAMAVTQLVTETVIM